MTNASLPPLPWRAVHHADWAEIVAADGTPLIAALPQMAGYDGHKVADQITTAVNKYEAATQLIADMAATLSLMMDDEKISWSDEQDGSVMLERARKFGC